MNSGSRDEARFLTNIDRIARALERIADKVEEPHGLTATQMNDLRRQIGQTQTLDDLEKP